MKKEQKIIVKRIKELLKSNNMSQVTLAFRSGISQQTITNILNFKTTPNETTIKTIAETFGVFPEYLTSEVNYKNRKEWKNKNNSNRLTKEQKQAVLDLLVAFDYEITEQSNNYVTLIKPNGTETKLYIKHLSNITDTFITLLDVSLLPSDLF